MNCFYLFLYCWFLFLNNWFLYLDCRFLFLDCRFLFLNFRFLFLHSRFLFLSGWCWLSIWSLVWTVTNCKTWNWWWIGRCHQWISKLSSIILLHSIDMTFDLDSLILVRGVALRHGWRSWCWWRRWCRWCWWGWLYLWLLKYWWCRLITSLLNWLFAWFDSLNHLFLLNWFGNFLLNLLRSFLLNNCWSTLRWISKSDWIIR